MIENGLDYNYGATPVTVEVTPGESVTPASTSELDAVAKGLEHLTERVLFIEQFLSHKLGF